MSKNKYWPLDFDPEGEVYENLAWDLPGYTHRHTKRGRPRKITARLRPSAKKLR